MSGALITVVTGRDTQTDRKAQDVACSIVFLQDANITSAKCRLLLCHFSPAGGYITSLIGILRGVHNHEYKGGTPDRLEGLTLFLISLSQFPVLSDFTCTLKYTFSCFISFNTIALNSFCGCSHMSHVFGLQYQWSNSDRTSLQNTSVLDIGMNMCN